jgi:DsbC/DsbD-like thiol-disulfide interchange protein
MADRPYRVRFIGGERSGDDWTAGIDVILDEGWKTYWRMPGDAGIPPAFDWTGSANAKTIDLLLPAPERLKDGSGEVIGYKRRVVFPIRIVAENAGAAPALRLAMFFGVCKDICIPARFSGNFALTQGSPEEQSLIQAYLARVPERRRFIAAARVADGALQIEVLEDAPHGADVFIESDTLAYFRAPRETAQGYALPIDGLKDPLSLSGKTVRVTLAGRDQRLEQDVTVE